MNNHRTVVQDALTYIEAHLDEKLTLEQIARVGYYSKYHVHRLFSEQLGMTVGGYVKRRQLTEAAKKLVFSERSVLEIALGCGYESQQAFTAAFSEYYKVPPAAYRQLGRYYPLQLPFCANECPTTPHEALASIRLANIEDVSA